MASFSSLKYGFHSDTRICLFLSRSLLASVLPNPGNSFTPFSTSQQHECLRILSCAISDPGIPSYPLTSWAIFSICVASISSST